jgi:hypothetical protein
MQVKRRARSHTEISDLCRGEIIVRGFSLSVMYGLWGVLLEVIICEPSGPSTYMPSSWQRDVSRRSFSGA